MSKLRLDILPEAQRALWPALERMPEGFVLYGGTAIALRLGHRQSEDFDYFARSAIEPDALFAELMEREIIDGGAEVLQLERNTLTLLTRTGVRLSCFGLPKLPLLYSPLMVDEHCIADLRELAGMKALVVQKRAELKDYLDIDALIQLAGLPLIDHLRVAKQLYGQLFAPELTLKSLCHFEDGNLRQLSAAVRQRLLRVVRGIKLADLP
jgi:hypothetical protein